MRGVDLLRTACGQLTRLLLPTRCALCQELGAEVLCPTCRRAVERAEPHCTRCGRLRRTSFASPDCGECHGRSIGVQRSRSAFVYNEAGRELLGQFKFQRHLGAGEALTWLALERLPSDSATLFQLGELQLDAVVPVPLHRARIRKRGFNQSEFIAQRLASHCGLDCRPELLERSRDTPTQVGLSATQRQANVRGAFSVPKRCGKLDGKTVLLVDDLLTTGSTLAACSAALRRAGCRHAYGFTLFSTHHDYETPDGKVGDPVSEFLSGGL